MYFFPYLRDLKTPIKQLDGFEKVTFYANAGAEVLEGAGMTNVDGNLLHRMMQPLMPQFLSQRHLTRRTNRYKCFTMFSLFFT